MSEEEIKGGREREGNRRWGYHNVKSITGNRHGELGLTVSTRLSQIVCRYVYKDITEVSEGNLRFWQGKPQKGSNKKGKHNFNVGQGQRK